MRLVADIGGTNARFACVAANGEPGPVWSTPVSTRASFEEALEAYLAEIADAGEIAEAAVAAAGPVDRGEVQLTNARWIIRDTEISRRLARAKVAMFNDLEAVALALPHLEPSDLAPIGRPMEAIPRSRLLAVNVGTGFGAAVAIPVGENDWVACPSEAGHMSFPGGSAQEHAVLERLGAGSIEDALSGERFLSLYRAVGGDLRPDDKPEIVVERCAEDPAAREAIRLFTVWLGRACGDLALATASWGGVFLTGGLVESWRKVADMELFSASFAAKGKMSQRMAGVATALVMRQNVALLGLARAPL